MPARKQPIFPIDEVSAMFGQSRYADALTPPAAILVSGNKLTSRRDVLASLPDQPGIYGLVDASGRLIYVGMSRQLRRRLPCYFSSQTKRRKELRIGKRTRGVIWQQASHELIARLRERELIRRFRPDWNVEGTPTKLRLGYVALTDGEAPSFVMCSDLPKRHAGIWGPLPLTPRMKAAVGELNFHFQLRDCTLSSSLMFPDDPSASTAQASACLRADLRTCLAPCLTDCTRRQYQRALTAAVRFLDGKDDSLPARIESAMLAAAKDLQFEKAARFRERMQLLVRFDRVLRRFDDWRRQANFVLIWTSLLDGQEWWMAVTEGCIASLQPRPRGAEAKKRYLQTLRGSATGSVSVDDLESIHVLRRWFRHAGDDAVRRIPLATAKRLCRAS